MADSLASTDSLRRPGARQARALGAAGVASVSTLVAAVAHATAGGGWPNLATVLVALVASTFVGLPLVGARVRNSRLALAVGADQLVFHALFSSIGAATAVGPAAGAAHAHHAGLPAALVLGSPTVSAGLGMSIHHLLAGVVSFALLRGGWELLLLAIRRGAAYLVPTPSSPPTLPATTATTVSIETSPNIHVLEVLRHAVSRRGPPLPASLG